MAQAQVMEGTTEEIMTRLQQTLSGERLRVFVEPEEADLSAGLPDPPNTVRDEAHPVELLREGMRGPLHPVTDADWEDIRREVRARAARRQQATD